MFGVQNPFADAEVVSVAYDIMTKFGAKNEDFKIKISSRNLLDDVFNKIRINEEKRQFVYRLLDKKEKMSDADFRHSLVALIGESGAKDLLENLYFGEGILTMLGESEAAKYLNQVINILRGRGISNLVFDPTLTRGFDYYTGTVFEVYDTNKVNPRALFGGGRYDDLVGIFGVEKVSGVGFGMGDVTIRDFLETYSLLPEYQPPVKLYICHLEGFVEEANKLAAELRLQGVNVAVDLSDRKVSQQVKTADKELIPYILVVGEEEVKSGKFKVKSLKESKEAEEVHQHSPLAFA
jgi:histidyl-tRNA synthetase